MFKFSGLKIRNKLRVLSIFSILSLIALGVISNYFYNTAKVLGLMINAERVHNNTFQKGIEDFYNYQISNDEVWLDKAIRDLEAADQMALKFGTADQLAEQLPHKKFVEDLFETYKDAYNNNFANAELMANRIKVLLLLKPAKMTEAQQTAMDAYKLGESLKQKFITCKKDSLTKVDEAKVGS